MTADMTSHGPDLGTRLSILRAAARAAARANARVDSGRCSTQHSTGSTSCSSRTPRTGAARCWGRSALGTATGPRGGPGEPTNNPSAFLARSASGFRSISRHRTGIGPHRVVATCKGRLVVVADRIGIGVRENPHGLHIVVRLVLVGEHGLVVYGRCSGRRPSQSATPAISGAQWAKYRAQWSGVWP
jgi:hypothetical protein